VPHEAALDTTVLRRANVPLQGTRADATLMAKRLALLRRIRTNEINVLVSQRLIQEYSDQLKTYQNEFVKTFMELATQPDGRHVILNWKDRWSGGDRERAARCRYPHEDNHVLRTAIRPNPSMIYSEEHRMLRADACIYRVFRVHILEPS
jgi:hypothetical protein